MNGLDYQIISTENLYARKSCTKNVHDEAFQHLRDEKHGKAILLPTMLNRVKMPVSESDSEEVTFPGFRLTKNYAIIMVIR